VVAKHRDDTALQRSDIVPTQPVTTPHAPLTDLALSSAALSALSLGSPLSASPPAPNVRGGAPVRPAPAPDPLAAAPPTEPTAPEVGPEGRDSAPPRRWPPFGEGSEKQLPMAPGRLWDGSREGGKSDLAPQVVGNEWNQISLRDDLGYRVARMLKADVQRCTGIRDGLKGT
jgi:hypothetical protein